MPLILSFYSRLFVLASSIDFPIIFFVSQESIRGYEPLYISRDPSFSKHLRAYLLSKKQTTTKPSQGYLGAFFSWSSRWTILTSIDRDKSSNDITKSTTPVLLLHSDVFNVVRVDSGHHLPDWSYPPVTVIIFHVHPCYGNKVGRSWSIKTGWL